MKQLLLLGLIGLLCCAPVSAQVVTNGLSIALARKAMESAGYKQTGLEMYYNKPNHSLEFWDIGEGVLIIGYSTVSEAITKLGFFLCDERAKAFRKTFSFEVASFDTATGLMAIKTSRFDRRQIDHQPRLALVADLCVKPLFHATQTTRFDCR